MSTFGTEQPLFIDPVAITDDEVDETPSPAWFKLAAVVLLSLAVYYLFTFLDGPRLSSNHIFVPGRAAYEDVVSPSPAP